MGQLEAAGTTQGDVPLRLEECFLFRLQSQPAWSGGGARLLFLLVKGRMSSSNCCLPDRSGRSFLHYRKPFSAPACSCLRRTWTLRGGGGWCQGRDAPDEDKAEISQVLRFRKYFVCRHIFRPETLRRGS